MAEAAGFRRRRLEEVLDHLPAAVAILSGDDLVIDYANAPARALTSAPLEGRAGDNVSGENLRILEAVAAIRDSGIARTIPEAPLVLGGVERRFDISIVPVEEGANGSRSVLVHAVDVTEQVEAKARAQQANARAARLQELTGAMSAATSPDEIARAIVHQAVEDLSASAAMIALVEGNDVVPAYSIGYEAEALEQWRRFPLSGRTPLSDAIREDRPVVIAGPEEWEAAYPDIAPYIHRFLGFAGAPLTTHDRTLGGLVLSFREARTLPPEDVEFLIALGRQAAQAFERARLFENRAYVARKLQEGLLPDRLDVVPGLEAAVRYQSISGGGEVGGDFYDLFEAGHGRWGLAIGDVCGKGTEAAVVTGLARHTVRAVARMEDGPADVLAFLNDELRRHSDPPSFCTVGFALIEPREGAFRVRMAAGGHPYPLLLRGDGEAVEEIRVAGTMLGASATPDLHEVVVTLSPGDALVFFTDGVTDARRDDRVRFGDERLRAAIEAARGSDAEGIAAAVETAVSAFQPVAVTDDRAILVVRAAR